jgi:hypothetical protein
MEILEVSKISNNNPFQRMEIPDISQNILSVYSFQRKEIPEVLRQKSIMSDKVLILGRLFGKNYYER